MHTYPWHVGDFLKDCAHLTDAEELAYRRLIDLYYTQEGAIPNRTHWVAKRIRMVGQEKMVGSVLHEFFTLEGSGVDGLWHQKRCDKELDKYRKRVDANRKNGKKGGRKPNENPVANPMGSKPRTRTRTNITPLPPEGEVRFAEFWNTYPRKEGKPAARKAFAKALGAATFEAIMAGLRRYLPCDQWRDPTKVPHASTWLNREGWNDQPAQAPAAAGQDGAGAWWASRSGVERLGAECGMTPPPKDDNRAWFEFQARVWFAVGPGEWVDRQSLSYPIYQKLMEAKDA